LVGVQAGEEREGLQLEELAARGADGKSDIVRSGGASVGASALSRFAKVMARLPAPSSGVLVERTNPVLPESVPVLRDNGAVTTPGAEALTPSMVELKLYPTRVTAERGIEVRQSVPRARKWVFMMNGRRLLLWKNLVQAT